MMYRRPTAVCALAVCLATPAVAEIPYAKLVSLQVAFQKLPPAQRDKLIFHLRVEHGDASNHSPVHLWVVDGSQKTDIQLAPDGALPDSPRQDWLDRDLQVDNDHPKGGMRTSMELLIRPPGGQIIPVAYLRDASRQAQQAITTVARQLGGYLATLAAPTVRGVTFRLAGCCTGKVNLAGMAFAQGVSANIRLPATALDANKDASVTATANVLQIDPTTD